MTIPTPIDSDSIPSQVKATSATMIITPSTDFVFDSVTYTITFTPSLMT